MSLLENFTPDDLELLPYPAYYLNESRIVVRRNKNAAPSRLAILVRARIDKYISNRDRKRVMELKVGEEIFIDLFFEPAYGAIICRIENGYLMAVRNITAHMLQYICKITSDIPTFFGNIGGQIESLRLATFRSREEMAKVRRQYYKVMRYQNALAKYFENITGKNTYGNICEISTTLNNMLSDAADKLRPNGINLSLNLSPHNIYAAASAEDLRYAAATLLSIAAENTYDGRIRVESTTLEDDYMFKIIFEPRVDDKTYDGMLDGYYGGELLSSVHGNVFFDLLLVQMLAERSGWYFSVKEVGCSRGVLGMSLFVPLDSEDVGLLNCPADTSALLEMMLVNVLGPNYDDSLSL